MHFMDHAPTDADFTAMRRRLLSSLPTQHKKMWRRTLLAGGGLLAASALAAAALIVISAQDRDRTATCYAGDSLGSNSLPVSVITDEKNPDRVQLAVDSCTAAWERDLVGDGSADPNNDPTNPVPPLSVCESAFGTLWVFPTARPTICDEVGAHLPK